MMKGKEIPHRVDHLVEDINNNQIIMVQCNECYYYEKNGILQKHKSCYLVKDLEMNYEGNEISAETINGSQLGKETENVQADLLVTIS